MSVIFSKRRNLQQVPEVGKKYHFFDDGKITFSRHYIYEVCDVVGHMQFKRQYPEHFRIWRKEVKRCYWLYSSHSDKFIIAKRHECEDNSIYVFVRTKQGEWFSIGGFLDSGLLDVTGKLWDELVKHIDNFSYTDEKKKRIIEENTI